MKRILSILIGLAALLAPATGLAGSASSVRAQGMGGAYTALAEGVDAPLWNPANLALRSSPNLSFELLSTGAWVGNNGIDLGLYERYNGATLDQSDKDVILGSIPASGLTASAEAAASVMGIQFRNMALSFTGTASGYSNLPHDVFELILQGNAIATEVEFDDADGEAIAFGSANFSTAVPAGVTPWGELYLGVNLRYLQGIAYGKVEGVSGALTTTTQGIEAQAVGQVLTAGMGQGLGVDLGITGELGDHWRAGLAVENAFARIHYDQNLERRTYLAETDDLDVTSFEEVENAEDLISNSVVVEAASPFTVTLPRVLRMGAARLGQRTSLALDLTQGFATSAVSSATAQVALGAELRPVSWLPLRAGLSVGGATERSASVGLGLGGAGLALDLAAATIGELWPGDPRGVRVAAGLGLRF